ncbi:MAG: phytanoyl-CoA dioxygenase family protein [Rhodospirillaceae bacterium]|nr:phytanoyl-CoA dioxygenase family protein [Rhodospirillaceae bacterium]
MPKRLTEQQVEQYKRDGCVSPVRVISEDDAAKFREKLQEFETAQGAAIHGTQKTKCSLLFPWAYELFTSDAVLDAVEDLIGPNILQYQCGVWIKEPESGSYVSWHQDSTYYGMDPLELVSGWVALSPATAETGCMQVLPGSHKAGQLPVDYTEGSDDNLLASGQATRYPVDESQIALMELQPGEMSLHHVALVHSSRPNHGADRRIGIAGGYLPPHVAQTTDLKASAMLVRGEDNYGHYPLIEQPPRGVDDTATIACHDKAVQLYRDKSVECGNQTAWRYG